MATPRQLNQTKMRSDIRDMKSRGMTNSQIAGELNISKGLSHYYSRPDANERICPRCCQPFKAAKVKP